MLYTLQLLGRELVEWVRVVKRYYRFWQFLCAEIALAITYTFSNPYRTCRLFFKRRGDASQVYGETPITTLALLADKLQVSADDTVVDLGCGRGRLVFWLSTVIGCSAVGVDCIEAFIVRARRITQLCRIRNADWQCADMLDVDLSRATLVYVFGTTLADAKIVSWVSRLRQLPAGARVVTVSYSLLDYEGSAFFELADTYTLRFAWGDASVYVNVRKQDVESADIDLLAEPLTPKAII